MRKLSSEMKSNKNFASVQQVYDCALDLLSYRDYSELKLRERLLQKGATEEQVDAALVKLRDYGFTNERRYAENVYEAWLGKRYYGRLHLQAELRKRGVTAELIDELLQRFTPELEEAQAKNAAELFLQRNRQRLSQAQPHDKKIYAAAGRFMAARGFSAGYMTILWEKLRSANNI